MNRTHNKAIKAMRANDQWYYIKTQGNMSKFNIGDLIYDPRDESIGLIIAIDTDFEDAGDFAYKCFDTLYKEAMWVSGPDIDKNCELLEKVEINT